jgi:hypothetical protein
VTHLYGGRFVGSLALIKSVEEVQEDILYRLATNRRKADNSIGAHGIKLLISKIA